MDDDIWFKPRSYLHFDPPISKKNASTLVKDPALVKSHAFYPLIQFSVETQKIRFDRTTNKIERKKPKTRNISYASHLDSHIYSYYNQILNSLYEKALEREGISENVLAFRAQGKSNIHFANQAFCDIASRKECCAIGLDIKGFFDNLDHLQLKKAWADLIGQKKLPQDHYAVFKSITNYSFVDRTSLYKALKIPSTNPKNGRTRICSPEEFRCIVRARKLIKSNKDSKKGIPQGSPISALLSNIYMIDFDKAIQGFVKKINGTYYRYCDDMLIIVPRSDQIRTQNFVYSEIKKLNLEIQKDKNEIRIFKQTNGHLISEKPLQYLGFTFDGRSVLIRSGSLARYYERANRSIRLAKATMEKYNTIRIERGDLPRALHLKKLYKRHTYLGRRNFLSYGYRAAKILNSKSIKKQLRPHWERLRERIERD